MTERPGQLAAALADRYRIERELGHGGMATVYLAHDLKHDRKVALKVLKPELAAVLGAERFVVEIKTTAALQHPHILPLFDSGTADGFLFYVMPFIDGETLRGKLDRETQLGIEEAVKLTTAVADALDYAHRHGVIHRDIKPENILLHDGRPMVADFGIALALSAAAGGRMTETGLSLGTPHYMSPEQATAEKEITARSDVYSLGSVLYEMLTGSPPHVGATAQQIIMKIVTEEAAPVTRVRKSVPPNVAAAVARAIERLPADRFDSARGFAEALVDERFRTFDGGEGTAHAIGRGRSWLSDPRSWAALAAVIVLAGVALVSWRRPTEVPPEQPVVRFTITGPVDSSFVQTSRSDILRPMYGPAVSPDGRYVVFGIARTSGLGLLVRASDGFEVSGIDGNGPFFSPDGRELGFLRSNEVWSAALADPVPSRVGAIPEVRWDIYSAIWHPDGRMLVSASRGLWVLPAKGGEPSLWRAVDSTAGERFGELGLLADGRIYLNVATPTKNRLEVVSLDAPDHPRIVPGVEGGAIVGDILFFHQAGQVRATRFDLGKLEAVGESVALPGLPEARLARSIAWVDTADVASLEPVWVTRDGRITPVGLPPGQYEWPRVSPDGRRVVLKAPSGAGIVTVNLAQQTMLPLLGSTEPVWSSEGSRVFISLGNRPKGGVLAQIADGSRPPDTLLTLERGDSWPTSASPDGVWLAFYGATLGTGTDGDAGDPNDLFFLDLNSRETTRFRLPGIQRGARFSPDGRWIAYQSSETGRDEVYVRPWPAMDANFLVSSAGGTEPVWSRDGREVYYRNQNDVLAVAVAPRDGSFERAPPRVLFSGALHHNTSGDQSWDLAPDGRFLMLRPQSGGRARVHVALNWINEVRARLGSNK